LIGRLTGRLLECAPGKVLLDVSGVGYEVQIPLSTFYELASGAGAAVSLRVHTHVREDALQLFGFSTDEERTVFEQLISISGVGPRLALAILSGIGVAELHEAIYRRNRERLQKIPGVGKKTAERVLLELRDKLNLKDAGPPGDPGAEPVGRSPAPLQSDAISALVNLGYSASVAERAVQSVARDGEADTSLESILKNALRGLAR
jgi:Holliday junction DNA helicase RuvA